MKTKYEVVLGKWKKKVRQVGDSSSWMTDLKKISFKWQKKNIIGGESGWRSAEKLLIIG